MTSFLLALRKYAVFSGRSARKEYWMYQLFAFLIVIALTVVDVVVGTYDEEAGIGLVAALFILAILVPHLALTARRLHDLGKSGWFQLLFIIPCIGLILWVVFMVQTGEPGANQYGPSPKEVPQA